MKLQPLQDKPAIVLIEPMPRECCAKCRFWDAANFNQDNPEFHAVSNCLRFPPRLVVLPVPPDQATLDRMGLDPRMAQQLRQGMIPMSNQPRAVRDISNASEWCGEFDPLITGAES